MSGQNWSKWKKCSSIYEINAYERLQTEKAV